MKPTFKSSRDKVLKALAGEINDFYLAGGTALSLYYFRHRESVDLDFFTRRFDKIRITQIIKLISGILQKKPRLIAEQLRKDKIRIVVYSFPINKREALKIDFVEDYLPLIKAPKDINGIKVLSLEDIYIRKIYCAAGTSAVEDSVGRKVAAGGRQEAKDFYDLYCLSNTFMRLSDFSFRYYSPVTREALVRWFRTYSRMEIKTGLLELKLKREVDYPDMERHFKKEIDRILEKEVAAI